MSVVAAVTAVVGLGVSISAQAKQERLQEEAREVTSAAQKIEDAAKLRKQAREARVQRSRILQASEAAGGGSRESGAVSSLSTQLGEQQSRVVGQQQTSEALGGINQEIASAQTTKAIGQTAQQIGTQAFQTTGGFDNLFKGS